MDMFRSCFFATENVYGYMKGLTNSTIKVENSENLVSVKGIIQCKLHNTSIIANSVIVKHISPGIMERSGNAKWTNILS